MKKTSAPSAGSGALLGSVRRKPEPTIIEVCIKARHSKFLDANFTTIIMCTQLKDYTYTAVALTVAVHADRLTTIITS